MVKEWILRRLTCLFRGHLWLIVDELDVPTAFAMMYGNVVVRCDRCGKEDVRYGR